MKPNYETYICTMCGETTKRMNPGTQLPPFHYHDEMTSEGKNVRYQVDLVPLSEIRKMRYTHFERKRELPSSILVVLVGGILSLALFLQRLWREIR